MTLSVILYLAFLLAAGSVPRDRTTLVIGIGRDPGSLDPARVTAVAEGRVLRALFEGLTIADPNTLKPLPGAAKSWRVSPDGRQIEFTLRDRLQWSNGDPLTAEDFRYSWLRLLDPREGCAYGSFLWPIVGAREYTSGTGSRDAVSIRCPDPQTLIVELEKPVPYFLSLTSFYPLAPVHRQSVEESGGSALLAPNRLVSNGPYSLADRWLRDRVRVEKNPHYWESTEVSVSTIDFLSAESPTTLLNIFLTGEADWITQIPHAVIPNLVGNQAFAGVFTRRPHLEIAFLRVNATRPERLTESLRRALSMSIDRRELCERVIGSGEQPAWSFVPWPQIALNRLDPMASTPFPEARACLSTEGVLSSTEITSDAWGTLGFDPEQARELMRRSGFRIPGESAGSPPPELELLYSSSSRQQRVAEWLQETWARELGVEIILRNLEGKSSRDAQRALDYDVATSSWVADYLDPMTFLEVFRTDSGSNRTGWSDANYDDLLARAERTPDGVIRDTLLFEAERQLLESGPVIPLWYGVTTSMISPELQGLGPNALDQQWPKLFRWTNSKSDGETR